MEEPLPRWLKAQAFNKETAELKKAQKGFTPEPLRKTKSPVEKIRR
jgi:hypothetical protein